MSDLAELLSRGNALARKGDLADARAELEKAARDFGSRAEPLISLAAVHGMAGDYEDAFRCARKAAELAPNSLQAWVNLAHAAQACGDIDEASNAFSRALNFSDCPSEMILDYGLVLSEGERWPEAVELLQAYHAMHPEERLTTYSLAHALSMSGKPKESNSLLQQWFSNHPEDASAVQFGFVYLSAGQVDEARQVLQQAEASSPDDEEVMFLKGALSMHEGQYEVSRDVYERLIKLQQPNPTARVFLLAARASRQAGAMDAAEAYAREAEKLNPRSIPVLATLSTLLQTKNPDEAREWMEKAAVIAPQHPLVNTLKAAILEFEGDKQGAWGVVKEAFEAGTIDIDAAIVAANVAPVVGKTEEAIEILETLLEQPGISVGDQRNLRFRLAKLFDKAGQYDRGFQHLVIANQLKNAAYNYIGYKADCNRLKAVYSEESVKFMPRSANRSELPVFILGMPRSGTSLMEQILSCHSKVHARGETTEIGKMVDKIPYYPDGVRNLGQEKLDMMADAYIQRLREEASEAVRVTDKMPGNYLYVGFISQLLPGARIINCRRDPRDICLSHFMIEFGHGLPYSYDLEAVALVCKEYQELMQNWHNVLSIPILDVRYEDVVSDPRSSIARVLEFCGLDWEDACLDFHKSDRQVLTASYDQVREPLYKSSVARWKNYEKHLEPVSRILGLHDDSYP